MKIRILAALLLSMLCSIGRAEEKKIYLKADGGPYMTGDLIRNPDYAATLRHLGRHGADDFFTGELAARMVRDLDANGAFVTAHDLASYKVRDAQPTVVVSEE